MGNLIRRRIEIDPLKFSSANTRRTPGIHLTSVIHDMLTVAGVMKKHKTEEAGGFSEAELERYQLQGYAWEDVFTEIVARRVCPLNSYFRLPEIAYSPITGRAFWVEYDPVTGELLTPIPPGYILTTPDGGVLAPNRGLGLAEIKWTTKSAKMDPERDKPEWFYQAKGYMGALAAVTGAPVSWVEWHVQFPVGEFWGCPPVYEQWEREYSIGEVADTWDALWSHVLWRTGQAGGHEWSQYV